MSEMYPNPDMVRCSKSAALGAKIISVEPNAPAYDAGFEPGCYVRAVNGQELRDILDWRWLSSEDCIELEYTDCDGDTGCIELERDLCEDWGFEFEGALFDGVKVCCNNCSFCFMRQLPKGMRPSLSLRDDDFRLSFLSGTFVTFTNMSASDEQRIIEQHISPLRFSLHAISADVRERLIGGKRSMHGLQVAQRLLAAGVQMHAQIVLVPGENDGEELRRTLEWAYAQENMVQVGIVPLGFTQYQSTFTKSFNDSSDARAVLEMIAPFQQRALKERGSAWVYAADEFYSCAYPNDLLEHLPPAEFYGEFEMFEDGVGIIRSFVDDWYDACKAGLVDKLACVLQQHNVQLRFVVGKAMDPFLGKLIQESKLHGVCEPLSVANAFFGGNVDVTGLLTGQDVAAAIQQDSRAAGQSCIYVIPDVVLNDDGVFLDDMLLEDVSCQAGAPLYAVSCNPTGFLVEIIDIVATIG